MSQLIYFGGSGGSIENLDTVYEGGISNVVLTGGASSNTKGSPETLATTVEEWDGFWLCFGKTPLSSSQRSLVDVSYQGFAAPADIMAEDIFVMTGTSGIVMPIWVQLRVPASAVLQARLQTGGTSQTLECFVIGRRASDQSRPGFTKMKALNIDTAATWPSATDVPLTGVNTALHTTTDDYGALLAIVGPSPTGTPATAQSIHAQITADGSAIGFGLITDRTGNPIISAGNLSLIEQSVASGVSLGAKLTAATPGSDVLRVALYGLS